MAEPLVDEVQVLVDRLAERLQQSAAIDDPEGNIVAISRHYGDEDGYRVKLVLERRILPAYHDFFDPYVRGLVTGRLESPIRVPSNPELLVVGRIGYAIRAHGRVIAILWLIDRGTTPPHDIVDDYCSLLGDLLAQRRNRKVQGPALARDTIQTLLSGHDVSDDETTLWLSDSRTGFIVCAHLADHSPGQPVAAPTFLHGLPHSMPHRRLSLACLTRLDGLDVAVYGSPTDAEVDCRQDVEQVVTKAAASLTELPGRRGVGVSGPGGVDSMRRLYVEAALAAFLACRLNRDSRVLHAAWTPGMAGLLCTPLDLVESPRLEALKSMLADRDGFAYETVGALLHSDGSQAGMIELLRVHRTTLHYRITQIRQHTGLDLQAPADMFLVTQTWLRVTLNRSPVAHLAAEYRETTGLASSP